MDVTCPHCNAPVAGAVRYCTACGEDLEANRSDSAPALTRVALAGVIAVMFAGLGLMGILYLLPPEHLRIGDIEPVVRVAREADFTIGTSRLVAWGERSLLVVRRTADQYHAVQGYSPADGCFLQWDEEAMRVTSPCTNVVYDLQGNVVTGLSRRPLVTYRVFASGGTIFVTERDSDG